MLHLNQSREDGLASSKCRLRDPLRILPEQVQAESVSKGHRPTYPAWGKYLLRNVLESPVEQH